MSIPWKVITYLCNLDPKRFRYSCVDTADVCADYMMKRTWDEGGGVKRGGQNGSTGIPSIYFTDVLQS